MAYGKLWSASASVCSRLTTNGLNSGFRNQFAIRERKETYYKIVSIALSTTRPFHQSNIPSPGNNPPSNAPKIIRHATSPLNPCVIPVKVATTPQAVVINDSHREGVNFLMTRLLGSSLAMYVTKSRETAIWYSFSFSLRSSSMP